MTVANDPKLAVNRYPWNRNPSIARDHVEGFIAAAERRIDLKPEGLPFKRDMGRLVLAWLRGRLNAPPE